MNPILKPFYQDQEQKYPKNLEANFSRVMGRILELWGTHELDAYLSELMIDTKGGRQGFPPAVISELLTLSMVHDKFMAIQDAESQDVWSNEAIRAALEEEHIEYSRKGFFNALDSGNTRAIEIFIQAKVNLEETNASGWTPLMVSSFMGSEQAAKLLINAGANVNARDERGYGPLHWAAYRGFLEITKMLLEKGAFVNAKSKAGLTPLLQAASCGHQDVVTLLISKGASVNEPDEEGWTPLHKAVANGHEAVVKLLMDASANPEIPHNSGLTATKMAQQKKNQKIINFLMH